MNKLKLLLSKKLLLKLVITLTFVTVMTYLFFYLQEINRLSIDYILILGLIMTSVAVIVYIVDFVNPIRKVILQIKMLLAGRDYKKIYTARTDEIGIIAHFFNEVTDSFERVNEQLAEGRKVNVELQIAGNLQKELMPIVPPAMEGFEIAVKNRSAEELGGDNFDFMAVKDSVYFYVGDVTGHGLPAAIVMTMVNTLLNAFVEIYDTAYDIVVNTNRRLKRRIRATMFMTMLMLKWNKTQKKLSYIGCGHEHLIIYRAKLGKCEVTVSGGIALGMVADNSKIVKEKEVPLEPGDVIVLYTDGITEAKNMKGEMFGLNRLVDKVNFYAPDLTAAQLVQNIAKDFSIFVEEHVQEDDVTLIVLKYTGSEKAGEVIFDQKVERWSA